MGGPKNITDILAILSGGTMTLDSSQMWSAIAGASSISQSVASQNLRTLAKTFTALQSQGLASPEMPRSVTVRPTIESTTGKLVSTIT